MQLRGVDYCFFAAYSLFIMYRLERGFRVDAHAGVDHGGLMCHGVQTARHHAETMVQRRHTAENVLLEIQRWDSMNALEEYNENK